MNNVFVNNIGDLAEAQRASFYHFLFFGISDELKKLENPFFSKVRIPGKRKKIPVLIYLYLQDIKLKGPLHDVDFCLQYDLTYTIELYIPSEYSYPLNKLSKYSFSRSDFLLSKFEPKDQIKQTRIKQDIFLGEIPLMTNEGTFIVNGCERIVISQIIRSPGIYFRKEYGSSIQKTKYTATIISNKGLWTKFILDTPKGTQDIRIYIKLRDFKRKPGLSDEEKALRKSEEEGDNNRLFIYDIIKYFGLNMQEISDSIKNKELLNLHQFQGRNIRIDDKLTYQYTRTDYDISVLIHKLFANQRSGCFSIGEVGRYKINKKLGLNLPKYITYLTAHDFIEIINGLVELKTDERLNDDIDDIKNKLVRSVGVLLQNQIRVGVFRLQKNIRPTVGNYKKKVNFELENSEDFQELILDPRPLTISIRDFFKTSQLSQFMDQTNPLAELTHKRRISVFGPNGLQRDHISTVIRDIHPSQYGRLCPIETPEGQNAGLINAIALFGRINSLGSLETPYFLMNKGTIFSAKQPIYLNPDQEFNVPIAFGDVSYNRFKKIDKKYISIKENYLFSLKKIEEMNFITISPLQIVSVATALIPFLEHDDANRALMGSNMQRQAVPLLYTQKPIVGTGLETIAILDSGMVVKSYCEGTVKFSSATKIIIKDSANQSISYYLRKYIRSNQDTSINQKPVVWLEEKVFSGQIIADGPSTNDGELSLGRNLLIAYMPWEGYNYEDAIIINERILLDDCLTSVHIEEVEINLTSCLIGDEKLTRDVPYLTKYIRRHLDKDGVVKIGSYVYENDILIGKATLCTEEPSPEKRLLNALYNIKDDRKEEKKEKKNYRDTSFRVAQGTEGRVIDIRIVSTILQNQDDENGLSTLGESIRISIAQIRKIQVGDKLSGRHGNKGIISRILAKQDMPYLPDGTPVDIIFNPLGVPSRMNVGQVFECLLGLAGEKLGNRFKVTPFDEIYGQEASRILVNQKLKEASLYANCPWIFNTYYPGKILLRDGRTGEYFDNPITVGKSYILKLIHLVEDKIHARATGPYAMITEQPLAGKSQKGGQRFGEMEVWALEAYGCSYTLQELLTIKSDDIDGRNDMYESILIRKESEKPTPSIPESFLTLIRELHALGLDFSLHKMQGGFDETTNLKETEVDLFKDMEVRLKLRALLSRQKIEQFSKTGKSDETNKQIIFQKNKQKMNILKNLFPNENSDSL